jgi:FkbM family methyltransferase
LSSLAFQTGQQQVESLHLALKALGEAYDNRDLGALYRSTVALSKPDGSVACVDLCSANSQLHGLNVDADGFKFGYEPEISAVVDFFVGNEGCLVDVGANFGYFPIYLASRLGFKGTAHAFEPSERGFEDLARLVDSYGLSGQIRIHQCALGDVTGETELFLSNSDGLTTMVASMASRLEKVVATRRARISRLDDFSIDLIDVIKIDVEGAEAMVIAGGLNAIKAHKPVVIFESWITVDDSSAFTHLDAFGYRYFVPTWKNQQGHMSISISDAIDPMDLVLVMFQPSERKNLPERINVIAIPPNRLDFATKAS